jgi:hypothetical protein
MEDFALDDLGEEKTLVLPSPLGGRLLYWLKIQGVFIGFNIKFYLHNLETLIIIIALLPICSSG